MLNLIEELKQVTSEDLEQLNDLEFAVVWKVFKKHDDLRISRECEHRIDLQRVAWSILSPADKAKENKRRELSEIR
jgi:hypothetical protein